MTEDTQVVHTPELILPPGMEVPITPEERMRQQFELTRFLQKCYPKPVEGMVGAQIPFNLQLFFREKDLPEFKNDKHKERFSKALHAALLMAVGSSTDIIDNARSQQMDFLEMLEKESKAESEKQTDLPFPEDPDCSSNHKLRLVKDGTQDLVEVEDHLRLEGGL